MEIMEYELIRISKSGKFITIQHMQKRLKSQVNLHSIITNVHKSYVSHTLKVCGLTRPIGSMPKFDSRIHAATLPTPPTLFRRLVKLM